MKRKCRHRDHCAETILIEDRDDVCMIQNKFMESYPPGELWVILYLRMYRRL